MDPWQENDHSIGVNICAVNTEAPPSRGDKNYWYNQNETIKDQQTCPSASDATQMNTIKPLV